MSSSEENDDEKSVPEKLLLSAVLIPIQQLGFAGLRCVWADHFLGCLRHTLGHDCHSHPHDSTLLFGNT